MQEELDLARIIAPDTLCVFSAVIAQQVGSEFTHLSKPVLER